MVKKTKNNTTNFNPTSQTCTSAQINFTSPVAEATRNEPKTAIFAKQQHRIEQQWQNAGEIKSNQMHSNDESECKKNKRKHRQPEDSGERKRQTQTLGFCWAN